MMRNLLAAAILSALALGCERPRAVQAADTKKENTTAAAPSTNSANVMTAKVVKSDEEWKKQLTPEQYRITRKKGTERAFTGPYWNSKEKGTYRCGCCGQELFSSDHKFDFGTGWPSSGPPIKPKAVRT